MGSSQRTQEVEDSHSLKGLGQSLDERLTFGTHLSDKLSPEIQLANMSSLSTGTIGLLNLREEIIMVKRERKCLRLSWRSEGSLLWLCNRYYSQSIIGPSSNPCFNTNTPLVQRAYLIAKKWSDFPALHTSGWWGTKVCIIPPHSPAMGRKDWGQGAIQHLKTNRVPQKPGPQVVLLPIVPGEDQLWD